MENREIKFRAWDSQNKKMLYTGDFNIYSEKDNGVHAGAIDQNGDWLNLPLMQYIGLKDKNGTEIYEGDIVKLHSWKPKIKETKRQVIKWINSGLYMVSLNKNVSGHAEIPNRNRLEVIGNMYETPELLSI